MISQKDLYEIALDRQMYDDIERLNSESAHYTVLRRIFEENEVQLEDDFLWNVFLATLKRVDVNLDRDLWGIEKGLSYPQSSIEEHRKLLEFCDAQINNIDADLNKVIASLDAGVQYFIKCLILLKLYSLALRRYPLGADENSLEGISHGSHWLRLAAKAFIYINSGCENRGFSHHKWAYQEIVGLCEANVDSFFMAAMCSRAFWVPMTALLFNGLAETYEPSPELVSFINDYGASIRNTFFTLKKEI